MRNVRQKNIIKKFIPSVLLSIVYLAEYPIWYNLGKSYFADEYKLALLFHLLLFGVCLFIFLFGVLFQLIKVFKNLKSIKSKEALINILWIFLILVIPCMTIYLKSPVNVSLTKGMKEATGNQKIQVGIIEEWVNSLDMGEDVYVDMSYYQKNGKLGLPDEIIVLSPNEIVIKKTKTGTRYIRLIHGGAVYKYGIVIGVDSQDIPLEDVYASGELRADFEKNAFVWFKKRSK